MIEPTPLNRALAEELAEHVPHVPRHEIMSICSLAAALHVWNDGIAREGIPVSTARTYEQIRGRLARALYDFGPETDNSLAAAVLRRSDDIARGTLALMPVEGHA